MKFQIFVLWIFVAFLLVNHGRGDGRNETSASGEIPLHPEGPSICAERTITMSSLSPYSTAVNNTVIAIRIIWYGPLAVLGFLLNSFIIYLVAKHKKLQILSFGIALQIMAVNILMSVYLVTVIITTLAGEWVLGTYACGVAAFLSFTFLMIRTGMMFIFVLDRFLSVFVPYFYPRYKKKIAVSLSVTFWVLIVVTNIALFPGILDCYGFSVVTNTCIMTRDCSQVCATFGLAYFIVVGLPSTVVPLIMYTALYCKARSLRNETVMTANAEVGGSEEERSRERRATVTFFLLFVSLFAVTVPTTLFQAIYSDVTSDDQSPSPGIYIMQVVCTQVIALLVLTDPVVVMRHKDVRDILSNMKTRLVQKWCCKRLDK